METSILHVPLTTFKDSKIKRYDHAKQKELTIQQEQQLHDEISKKLSGLDDILSKAFKGMKIEEESSQSTAQKIIEEKKAHEAEEKEKAEMLGTDKLTKFDFEIDSDLS